MRESTACVAMLLAVPLCAQGWVDRSAANGPAPRYDHAMCYDAAHGYVLMYGGTINGNNVRINDTWTWNGATWTQMSPANVPQQNTQIGARNCAMTYHSATSQPLLFSGNISYTWSGSEWVNPVPVGPAVPIVIPTLAYDPVRQESVLLDANVMASVNIWNGSVWSSRRALASPPGFAMPFAEPPYMAFDPQTSRIALTGWGTLGQQTYFEWTGLSWLQRQPQLPGSVSQSQFFGAMATDTAHNRIVMFDVQWFQVPLQPLHTWTIANGNVTRISTPIDPTLRTRAAMAYDSARGVTVMFGGTNTGVAGFGDTWEFDLGNGPSYSSFGTGCLGSSGRPTLAAQGTSVPRVGQTFSLQLNNLPLTGGVFLWLGLSDQSYLGHPLPLDLTFLGAPNCPVFCSGDQLTLLPNVLGTSVWNFPVPPLPGATFFNQAFALDPTANALGITTSNGGRGVIGM